MIYSRLFVALFLISWVAFPSFADSPRKNSDFPPEAEYPEEANPESQPDSENGKKSSSNKKKSSDKVERVSISGAPVTKSWNRSAELVLGLNQSGTTADSNRSTAGLSSAFLMGGRLSFLRKKWGIELEPRYSFSPDQSVTIQPSNVVQTRTLSTLSILLGGSYRFAADNYMGTRYAFFAKAGYAMNSVKVSVLESGATTVHSAQASGLYIGVGGDVQWNADFSSSLDILYSLFPSGKLAPVDAVGGYSLWRVQLSNRLRLIGTDDAEPTKNLGVGLLLAYQSMGTPTPDPNSLAGGSETQIHALVSAFLIF